MNRLPDVLENAHLRTGCFRSMPDVICAWLGKHHNTETFQNYLLYFAHIFFY